MDHDGYVVWPVVGATVIFFTFFNRLLKSSRLIHHPVNSSSTMDTARFRWTWRNTVVSFIHSLVTSVWAIGSFASEPLLLSDMIGASTMSARLLIAFSTGYFIYDAFDMLANDRRRHIELLLHHCVVLIAFVLALVTGQYCGWAGCALIMEVNSTFLHARRLLKMANKDNSSSAVIVGVLQLMTFISCRLMTSAWMVKWLTVNRPRLPPLHFYVAAIAMAILVPMNMVLLYRLAKSDLRKSSVDGKKVS